MAERHRRVRRWAAWGAVCLVAGAGVNVSVAWACALWSPWELPSASTGATRWPVAPVGEWPESCNVSRFESWGMTAESAVGFPDMDWPVNGWPRVEGCNMYAERVGWPARAMWRHTDPSDMSGLFSLLVLDERGDPWVEGVPVPEWLRPGRGRTHIRALPLRPLAAGFAVNTALYAGVFAAAGLGPGWLRRRARRRCGACEVCGYARGVSAVCTECGAPVGPAGSVG